MPQEAAPEVLAALNVQLMVVRAESAEELLNEHAGGGVAGHSMIRPRPTHARYAVRQGGRPISGGSTQAVAA